MTGSGAARAAQSGGKDSMDVDGECADCIMNLALFYNVAPKLLFCGVVYLHPAAHVSQNNKLHLYSALSGLSTDCATFHWRAGSTVHLGQCY